MTIGNARRLIIIAASLMLSEGPASAQVLTPQIPSSSSPSASTSASASASSRGGSSTPAPPAAPSGPPPILTIDSLPSSPDFFIQEMIQETEGGAASGAPGSGAAFGPADFGAEAPTSRWARLSFGAHLGLSSATVVNTPFRLSQDELLGGRGSEFGVGLGVLLDFAMPGAQDEGYRLKVGFQRQSLKPDAEVAATYSPGQLETSALVLDLSLLYRYSLPYLAPMADLWIGAGGAIGYAMSTSRPNADSLAPASRVRNSYGFRAIVAVGAEVPVSAIHDIILEADWSFLRGYAVYMGFKTSL